MPLPNSSMSFTPFDILTAEELNDFVENDQALAAGTGFNTGAIPAAAIANSAVTSAKIDYTSFPYVTYTPTITGFTGTPTVTAKSKEVPGGRWVYINIQGTANASGAFTFTVPSNSSETVNYTPRVMNNSTLLVNPGLGEIASGSNIMQLFQDQSGAGWSSTGTKRVYNFQFFYPE